MTGLKAWLQDFPGQNGATATALVLIFVTGLTVVGKLILGQPFPDGYDTWIWALIALAGVNVAGMVGKRATDIEYRKAGTSPVSVDNATVTATVSTAQPAPAAAPVAAGAAPAQASAPTNPVRFADGTDGGVL
jgi:hypothetical protein